MLVHPDQTYSSFQKTNTIHVMVFVSSPMAIPMFTRIHESKASYVFGLLSLFLLIQNGCAFEFIVGSSNGWSPSDSNALNQWAESKRFQIGDSLVFNYAAEDSVLYVTKDDYTNCNTAYPIQKFTDGHTVYKFSQSGPHYFISGNEEHCHKNEKLVVVVLADRHNKYGNSPPPLDSNPSPPPPTDSNSPPPVESIPPPTESNSPPPVESNPSPPPTSEENPDTPSDVSPTTPHKNGASTSSSIISFLCSIGALLGSSLMLAS